MPSSPRLVLPLAALLPLALHQDAQDAQDLRGPRSGDDAPDALVLRAVDRGVEALLALEEGGPSGEWPYEGMIRNEGEIPIPYRVAGTSFVAVALATAPGLDEDDARRAALDRSVTTMTAHLDHPGLSIGSLGRSDPRIWAFVVTTDGLLRLRALDRVPPGREAEVDRAIEVLLGRLLDVSIPETGGWSYDRPVGLRLPAPAHSYVTAPAIQVLLDAREQGFEIDEDALELAVQALEAQREPSGAFLYKGSGPHAKRSDLPESAGRMVACEVALWRCGRSSLVHVRGALDAFLAHWSALDERRARAGTHKAPHGIAPFYFYFAHQYAAQAVELLDPRDRDVYRARLRELLLGLQSKAGSWNDRVFPRSASYGTSVAIVALLRPYGAE